MQPDCNIAGLHASHRVGSGLCLGTWEQEEMGSDNVNHPAHYTAYKGLEVIDLTEQMNFNRGNAVKYICRAGLKASETELEDLEKAKWYLDREIKRLKEQSHAKKVREHLAAGGTVLDHHSVVINQEQT